MSRPLTVAMFPEPGAWGPTNNLVAIGDVLRERGHRIVFVLDESFRGELDRRGYEEAIFRVAPPPEPGAEDVGGDVWVEYIRTTAPEFRKPTIEQLATVIEPIWAELYSANVHGHERLTRIFGELHPDVIVHDNVSAFPAVPTSGAPWVRMVSANPLEIADPALPPVFSGYPVGDRSGWDEFRAEYARVQADLHARFSAFCVEHGAEPLPEGEFQYVSPHLNLYLYAQDADYARSRPLRASWHRLDTTVRGSDRPFDLDEHLPGEGRVVYLSLGSLGSLDTGLMQRLIDVLDTTPHRVVVSLGELHEELRLGSRMYGEPFLPQPSVLPQCDLLITHGGNNTLNEGFAFALPMIGLPLFWDQYDNAQRLDDSGFGVRLDTYGFEDGELIAAIDRLLDDEPLHARLRAASGRIRANPGQVRGADLIEELGRTGGER